VSSAVSKSWSFDSEVARRFTDEAEKHIPNYHTVQRKSIQAIKEIISNKQAKVLDVGSALGRTLSLLKETGYSNLFGVEGSKDMLDLSFDEATLINSYNFPHEHAPFDVVIANWTLHFVKDKEAYLRDIYSGMKSNGLLVLSEKVQSSYQVNDLYYDFKRSNGVEEDQIIAKAKALEGVMHLHPLEWYFSTLKDIGFEQVEVIDASFSFMTLIARKYSDANCKG